MWKKYFTSSEIAKSVQENLERAGEAITKKAQNLAKTNQQKQENESNDEKNNKSQENENEEEINEFEQDKIDGPKPSRWKNLASRFARSTRNVYQEAQTIVEKEKNRFQARISDPDRPRKRPIHMPLDVDALRDAQVVYVTNRIICTSHPSLQSTVDGDITPARKLAAVGHLLDKRHDSKYMVWNLSEVEYDVSIFSDQVLLFSFPGSPSPPLGLLLKLLMSLESWLKADPENVAVLHCLTGKGRTSTVVASFLCWMGEAGFHNVFEALDYIATCKKMSPQELTIPSQRRYVQYFYNMLDGVRPSQPPLRLKRILLSQAPRFAKGPPRDDVPLTATDDEDEEDDADALLMGCAPYIQIFKAGQLVFTTAASMHYNQGQDELPFCQVVDGPISFHVETVIQGDVLIRCRHLTAAGQRVSMFRAAFHTGYVPPNVLRLTKEQLDGACTDKRFPSNFFVDLILEPCEAEMASKHLSGKADAASVGSSTSTQNEANERRKKGTVSGLHQQQQMQQEEQQKLQQEDANSTTTVTASAYDSMLHRDSRFWDVITARRQEHAKKMAAASNDVDAASPVDPEKDPKIWGPTIGKRRNIEQLKRKQQQQAEQTEGSNSLSKDGSKNTRGNSASKQQQGAFSIGFDWEEPTDTPPQQPPPGPKEKDALLDMLDMAIDETMSPRVPPKATKTIDTEEVIFDKNAPPSLGTVKEEKQNDEEKMKEDDQEESITFSAASDGADVALTSDAQPPSNENDTKGDAPQQEETKQSSEKATPPISSDSISQMLANVEDDDDIVDADTNEIDALLANHATTGDVGTTDLPADLDLDFDDDDLEDLENFLTK